jgi:hypothetical protein
MDIVRPVCCLAACLTLAAHAQQIPPNPYQAACSTAPADFNVTKAGDTQAPATPPPGKALVYVVESMPNYPFVTKKVNIALDGAWLGATDANTHFSFPVDPGPHHLCAVYQGHAASMDDEGRTLLLRLDAQPGHTYYLRYHAFFSKDAPGIAFFDLVDEDEGLFLVQRTQQATSTLKK